MTVPAYVDMERLCAELRIQPSDIDQLIENGELPPPVRLGYLKRWKWEQVTHYRDDIGHIYFVKCGEFVKIGFAGFLESRMKNLQGSNPYELELLCSIRGSIEIEQRMHRKFANLRHRGEWFRLEGALAEFIEKEKAGGGK